MPPIPPLPADTLLRHCDPARLGFETTDELPDVDAAFGQERALNAMRFGLQVKGDGFNIFALGAPGTGRLTTVQQVAGKDAAARPVPPDWCYLHNFQEPHRPRALQLPAGRARRFGEDMDQLIEDLGTAIPAAFESEHYQARVQDLHEAFKERQTKALDELREHGRKEQIALLETPTGFAFAPTDKGGEVLSAEEFNALPEAQQQKMKEAVERLQEGLQKVLRQFPLWHKELRQELKALNREIAHFAVSHLIDALKRSYAELPQVLEHLDTVQEDVIEHVDDFHHSAEAGHSELGLRMRAGRLTRYRVNVLVDHGEAGSAPVVYEDLPTHGNLLGRVEYQSHMGTLVTDFTLIKAGALHQANGGHLVLDVTKVLRQPFAWESLKRTLQSRQIRIESLERNLGLTTTTSLEPEPIPLDVKVILVGEPILYYLLFDVDPEFAELFKVAADFDDRIERSDETQGTYAQLVATLIRRHGLRPFHSGAVAAVIDEASRLSGDAERLSTHLRSVSDLLREADYWAAEAGRGVVEAEDVRRAVEQQVYRSDRLRQRVLEEIRRGTILIDTAGAKVGQVNGLSVIDLGVTAFGRPSRITATHRIGEGELVDIERETELGGALHSKGVLILNHFLVSRYARDYPLSISASLVFEQSYGMVEGDSASLAELCALLSSLADLPLRQDLAITGSVNQAGEVQPIGGVNEKVEGFFEVCRATSQAAEHGVIIPARNLKHLMLRSPVVEAVREGRFRIYAVDDLDQTMELLTGVPPGVRDEQGQFPADSINGRVEQRLIQLSVVRGSFARLTRGEDGNGNDG